MVKAQLLSQLFSIMEKEEAMMMMVINILMIVVEKKQCHMIKDQEFIVFCL